MFQVGFDFFNDWKEVVGYVSQGIFRINCQSLVSYHGGLGVKIQVSLKEKRIM